MRKFVMSVVIALAAIALVLPSVGHAGKLGGGLMEADPNEGFPGDSFVVRNLEGSECNGAEVVVEVEGPAPFGNVEETTIPKGDWQVTLTVPAGSTPGEYLIEATCVIQKGKGQFGIPYVPVTFTVLAQEEPSPEPSQSPSPPPDDDDGDVGAERETAPAAQPEVEAAAFTG